MDTKFIKYGKIKCKNQFSNIFGTTIQLIIRMKQLIEGQYELLKIIPDSKIILTIIDSYEQMKNRQEYLDIDSFIHETKKEINYEDFDIKFKDFFFTIMCLIDFSNNAEFRIGYKPLIFTSLKNIKKKIDNESYYFDISFENNKKLSQIIEENYDFSASVIYKPNFLFFYPTNNQDQNIKINIDDRISLYCGYTLSIIVVKQIRSENQLNHFILYVGLHNWIKIEDEEIKTMSKSDVFKEVSDQKQYRIELLGYCNGPKDYIIPVDGNEPTKFEFCDISKAKQASPETSNANNNHLTSYDHIDTNYNHRVKQELNLNASNPIYKKGEYSVSFVEFDYKTKIFKYISTKDFSWSNQRDKYLLELDQDSRRKSNTLFYESGKYFGEVGAFDDNEFDITVYSVLISKSDLIKRPIRILFREYFNEDDTSIDEEKLETFEDYFYPGTTMKELFEYCYQEFKGHPTELYKKDMRLSAHGVKIYYDEKLINDKTKTIESIIVAGKPTIVYFKKNETDRKSLPNASTYQNVFDFHLYNKKDEFDDENKLNYGKIKILNNVSNVYFITIQILIRMIPLIDKIYHIFQNNFKSSLIQAIIDVYMQKRKKQEFFNINNFIMVISKEFCFTKLDFIDFFSSILYSNNFLNKGKKIDLKRELCFTILKSKSNQFENESCIFDISFENNEYLSELIENHYEFSEKVGTKPFFLFFCPVNNSDKRIKIKIDDKINLKAKYTLSIIVVKNIQNKQSDNYVLFIGIDDWIRIDNEKTTLVENKEDIFNEITNQKQYQIELFGFCLDQSKSDFKIYFSQSTSFEYCDTNDNYKIKQESNQINKNEINASKYQVASNKNKETKSSSPSTTTHISPQSLQDNDNEIVITRCLRNYLYDEKKLQEVKKVTVPDKTKARLTLDNLIQVIINGQKSVVLSYYIEYENDYVVKLLEKTTKIKNLPPFFNIQVRPHRNREYRVCVLRRTSVFHIIQEMNDQENGFQFSVIFEPEKYEDMNDFGLNVMNYLYHDKNEEPLFHIPSYRPSFYFNVNKKFEQITNIKQIVDNNEKPVFVIWSSPTIFDAVSKIIHKHTVDYKINVE